MKIFNKKETIQQNIAFMAIFSALNIILSVISALAPIVSVFLFLLMPLLSMIVEFYCKDKYYPIYLFATIGLSLLCTIWNTETTVFYLIPSLLTGYIFGLFIKKRIPAIYSILVSSIIHFGLLLLFIPLVYLIYNVYILSDIEALLKLNNSPNIAYIEPAFLFLISIVQISFSYLIISSEIKRFNIEEINNDKYQWIYQLILMVSSILVVIFGIFNIYVAYVLLLINIYLMSFIVRDYIKAKYYHILIIFAGGLILNVIVFGLYFTALGPLQGFLLVGLTPFWVSFISLVVSFLKRENKKIK